MIDVLMWPENKFQISSGKKYCWFHFFSYARNKFADIEFLYAFWAQNKNMKNVVLKITNLMANAFFNTGLIIFCSWWETPHVLLSLESVALPLIIQSTFHYTLPSFSFKEQQL